VTAAGVALRPYLEDRDGAAVLALWRRALGDRWPISGAAFRDVLAAGGEARAGDHLVAVAGGGGGAVVGLVATQTRTSPGAPEPAGAVLVVAVDPAHRRWGVGRVLLDGALARLRVGGVRRVQLGGGGHTYFWPGVPVDLPDAWPFFAALGWAEAERSFDLVCPLRDYAPPAAVLARVRAQGITVGEAAPGDLPAVLAFEREHFPGWLSGFERATGAGAPRTVVLARAAAGGVLGTALVGPPAPAGPPVVVWDDLLGPDTGTIGGVGVAPAARGRGVGLALAAHATEVLRTRGAARSHAGWTWLVDWYGRLGYRPWREYRMSWRRL
jgi:beta-N-acetylhexosaminidase